MGWGRRKEEEKGRTIYMHTRLRVTQSPECARQEKLPSTCDASPGTGSDLQGSACGAQSENTQLKTRISKLFQIIDMRGVLEQPRHEETAVRTP